ncbi:MAG: hypothetical protein R2848_19250 [Thermomicrobiales bacterium]
MSTYLYPGDTTYLCAIDGDGLMVSLIISVFRHLGQRRRRRRYRSDC